MINQTDEPEIHLEEHSVSDSTKQLNSTPTGSFVNIGTSLLPSKQNQRPKFDFSSTILSQTVSMQESAHEFLINRQVSPKIRMDFDKLNTVKLAAGSRLAEKYFKHNASKQNK